MLSKYAVKSLALLMLGFLALPAWAQPVIDVTVAVDPSDGKIDIGEPATLTFYARLKGNHANAGNGVFSWALDFVIDDPNIVSVDLPSVDRSGWWNDPLSSSPGSPKAWGLQGVYDSEDDDTELGIGSKVRIFSLDVTGLANGETDVFVRPDSSDFADPDFQTWGGDLGGDYTGASATIIVPEPTSLALMAVGGIAALRRRRRR